MSRLRGDDDEMAAARRRHDAANAEDWRKDRAQSEEMWIQSERARKMEARRGTGRPSGNWRFEQLLNTRGHVTGWRVDLNSKIVGLLMLQGDDIQVISAADNPEDPDATEIMAAFIKLYPQGVRSFPAPRRELPSGSPFGPPRDWTED